MATRMLPRDMLHLLRTLIPQHGMGFRHGEETLTPTSRRRWWFIRHCSFQQGETSGWALAGNFLCEFAGAGRQVIMMLR